MTSSLPFDTPILVDGDTLSGPLRSPRNMLAEQTYGGHASVHDDETARSLGFKSAAIEGPTHFSQFVPLAHHAWGDRWLAEGCLSASYKMACHEDEDVQAFMTLPSRGETQVSIWMTRADGAEILRGTASVGAVNQPSAVENRIAALPQPDPLRVILRNVTPGMHRPRERVRMDFDDVMGALYPFSLRQKLTKITEPSAWYMPEASNPWGRSIIPFEMISVLLHQFAPSDPWIGDQATVDMFVDQEIRMIAGPLFVGEDYEIERTVVALSGSRRTESSWVRTDVFHPGKSQVIASMLLNVASFKAHYPKYDELLAAIRSSAG